MKIYYFEYKDIEEDDNKLEINFDLLRVRRFITTYNYNGEVISRNKYTGWWSVKSKDKLFKVLKNNIGDMDYKTREKYFKFLNDLEEKE